jgi:hypothetical protein
MKKFNYNELSHLAINCAIWIRHLHEGMPLYEPITKEMCIKSMVLGSREVHRIYPLEYLNDNFDVWFDDIMEIWDRTVKEIANRNKPECDAIYSEEFVKKICKEYACTNFDNIFYNWFNEEVFKWYNFEDEYDCPVKIKIYDNQ